MKKTSTAGSRRLLEARTAGPRLAALDTSKELHGVDLSLPFAWDDLGDYQIVSNHESYCVHGAGGEILPMYGSTFFGVGIAIRASGWAVSADDGVNCYLEATCTGTCVNTGELHIYKKGPGVASCIQGGMYQQPWELYAFGTCYHNTRTGVGRQTPGSCD